MATITAKRENIHVLLMEEHTTTYEVSLPKISQLNLVSSQFAESSKIQSGGNSTDQTRFPEHTAWGETG